LLGISVKLCCDLELREYSVYLVTVIYKSHSEMQGALEACLNIQVLKKMAGL
jgi:hypothetical protein